MWLLLFALIYSPNFREPLVAKKSFDDFFISGDPVVLRETITALADMHCPEWRSPPQVGVDARTRDWQWAVKNSRITGRVFVEGLFFRRYFMRIRHFRRQFPDPKNEEHNSWLPQ
jgi:hypothetical protein